MARPAGNQIIRDRIRDEEEKVDGREMKAAEEEMGLQCKWSHGNTLNQIPKWHSWGEGNPTFAAWQWEKRGLESKKWHLLVLNTAEGWPMSVLLIPNERQVINNNINDDKCWYFQPIKISCCGKDKCTCQRLEGFGLFAPLSPAEKSKHWLLFLPTNAFLLWKDKGWWRSNDLPAVFILKIDRKRKIEEQGKILLFPNAGWLLLFTFYPLYGTQKHHFWLQLGLLGWYSSR